MARSKIIMLTHSDLKKGLQIILDSEPYEVLETAPLKKAQRRVVIQSRVRNLLTGNVLARNFHQGDVFEEAELIKFKAKFIYSHRDKFIFGKEENPSQRFELTESQVGEQSRFLKPGQILDAITFNQKVASVSLPVKVQLKVLEAPPGEKGGRAVSGTKQVVLETGAKVATPLFVEVEDVIEINTETGEYVKRIE
ncbi:MAG: elongation factor P [Parcubacteria group bacterium Gr01-1014_30]|nr:MAG: elongation factor P [Parcubacteria group bacterium Gr01-1014_30]